MTHQTDHSRRDQIACPKVQGIMGAALTLLLIGCTLPNPSPAISNGSNTQPGVSRAALAMPDQYSAEVARKVLAAGGNAVDAAVAAAFTLAVTSVSYTHLTLPTIYSV